MADQEDSPESSREPGEMGSVSSQGQLKFTPGHDWNRVPSATAEPGETSTSDGGTEDEDLNSTKDSPDASILEEINGIERSVQSLENEAVDYSRRSTDQNVSVGTDSVSLKGRDADVEDWTDREGPSSTATREESEVRHSSLVPSSIYEMPGQSASALGEAAARLIARTSTDVTKATDYRVSGFLIQQLRSLGAKERELEANLGRERIEHVVEKVEGEVEFEGVIEEMWLSMHADIEAQEMERRERDFEMERREQQLEDEVGMLEGKVRRLEDELRLAHAEKDYALQKKEDEMDGIIHGMLVGMREGDDVGAEVVADGGDGLKKNPSHMLVAALKGRRAAVGPQKAIFLAFEDMLKEADERAEQDRLVIESTLHAKEDGENRLQQEQRRNHEKERQLESRLLATEKEVSRLSGVLREAELALSVEQERRKQARSESDQILETWREEKELRKESEEKVKRLVSFLRSTKEKLNNDEGGGGEALGRLASVVKGLDKELLRSNSRKSSLKRSNAVDSEQATRWKAQHDVIEAERDKLEEKLNLQLRRTRDREAEIEAMWVERESDLVTKCSHLEADIAHWEAKFKKRESELLQDRNHWEMELEVYRKQWADEKAGWEALVSQREEWLEEQVGKWASLLEDKDRDLGLLKTAHEELNEVLKADKQKEMLENSSQTSVSCGSSKVGRSLEESEEESCQFVREIEKGEDRHDRDEKVVGFHFEKDRLEKEELERKVSSTLQLMDELQTGSQINLKEYEVEKKTLETQLASKTAEVDQLVGQLNSRERQMEALMQKFRDEVMSIDREVEKERKEREEVMEMHFAGKRRLVSEIREKEESWQNDLEALTQELLESRDVARQKDEDINVLKENLQALDEHLKAEEQKLAKRINSLMQEKDVLTGVLEQEQKVRKMVETENQNLEEENAILLDELNAERRKNASGGNAGNINSWRNLDLQAAVGRVASVDKQIADAMTAIESLQEELKTREAQLAEAKLNKETEWEKREAALVQEHKEMISVQEKHWQQEWQHKEQSLLQEKEEILQQLAAEQEETEVMQGVLRELEWSLKHGDSERKAKLVELPKKEGMVKVHTSHLEEVDQYVLDLQVKLEESEKKRKIAEVALSVQDLKRAASLDAALVQLDRDGRAVRQDGNVTPHLSLENGINSLRIRTKSSLGERSGRSSFSSIRELQPDSYWEAGNSSANNWNGGQGREDYSLSVLPPVSPGRRHQKWLVDAAWLETVRKEQAVLRQQLQIERQRVSALGQVGAENRLIEAAVVRAVEEKHETACKVSELQQEVVLLRKMLAARSGTAS